MPFPCCSPAVPLPFPCRSPAVPLPCHEYAFHGRFVAGSRHADVMRTACELNVSDLPAVVFFLLPRGVPRSLLSEAGSWQGRGMVCVNRALTRQGNGMVCVNPPPRSPKRLC